MTFIASVIAKEGVAIVADSFGTTLEHSLNEKTFLDYIAEANDKNNIPIQELIELFEKKPSYTRNYVDKLFRFSKYSAITFTGAVYINGKEIKEIVKSISANMDTENDAHNAKELEVVLTEFCSHLKAEVIEHAQTRNLTPTDLIFSNFNLSTNTPQIYVIKISAIDKDNFNPEAEDLITFAEQSHLGIVTDGQNNFVERLIFGSLVEKIGSVKDELIKHVIEVLNLEGEQKDKLVDSIQDFEFLQKTVLDDMFSIKFRQLSLQEALDLAALLIKIVMDIQVYTEKIPTVGGLIRLAVIHEERGFEWISGHKLVPSNII
ncbi:hypothetical protein EZ449_05065 [Pedobacter frigidisoli]|uniref:Uncharacterized protein n=1 Tax=Pedobacter frigidisoli TaxID=2530455 RepID=A0A4R0P7V5_9SPHI|nr:hypothetical protein [Pedobacter frigidisoli]TCD11632.1 hypothetical protein EZ449_05065 [Pedobacter frigidisoli]